MNQDEELTVTLTRQEAKALRNAARLLHEVLDDHGRETAAIRGAAKLEVELLLQEVTAA